jgi:hypothetical protein
VAIPPPALTFSSGGPGAVRTVGDGGPTWKKLWRAAKVISAASRWRWRRRATASSTPPSRRRTRRPVSPDDTGLTREEAIHVSAVAGRPLYSPASRRPDEPDRLHKMGFAASIARTAAPHSAVWADVSRRYARALIDPRHRPCDPRDDGVFFDDRGFTGG